MARTTFARGMVVFLAVVLLVAIAWPSAALAQDVSHLEKMLDFVNEARAAEQVSPVALNPLLNSAAQRHAYDLAGGDFLSHTGSDGSSFVQRIEATGYRVATASENVLYQLGEDASEAFFYWFNSAEHRANILNPAYQEMGVGYAQSGSGKVYYVMILALRDTARIPEPTLVGNVAPGTSTHGSPVAIGDERLNESGLPPVAIYCAQGGGVTIWHINRTTSAGQQIIYASPVDIGTGLAQARSSGQNTLIASYADVSLWALTSNELQVNAGVPGGTVPYTFVIKSDRCGLPTVAAVVPTPAPVPVAVAAAPPAAGSGVHVVQAGENLFRIALRYGLTTRDLALANGISNPARIYVGQRLVIPGTAAPVPAAPLYNGPSTGFTGQRMHVVQPGETLHLIALHYGTTVSQLAAANGISNTWLIYAGQILYIP